MISHCPSRWKNASRLSIRRRSLVLIRLRSLIFTLIVLTVIAGPFALLMTQAQITTSEPSATTINSEASATTLNERDEDIFVIYRNEVGESVCREANTEEKRRILQRENSGSAHVIYFGGRHPGLDKFRPLCDSTLHGFP